MGLTKKERIALYALGCKVNQEEGAAILDLFPQDAFETVDFQEPADIYIVNTCTVTHLADKKSRQLLRRTARENPGAIIVAMGCYSQMNPQEAAALPGVDLVIGTNNRHLLPQLLEQLKKARKEGFMDTMVVVEDPKKATVYTDIPVSGSLHQRVRAYLKIEDGCNNFCSYCIIPYARGPVRSKPLELILTQGRELVAAGYPEIVLTGIHTGAYGSDLPGNVRLSDVAAALAALPGLKRLRLGSVEPPEVTCDLLDIMAKYDNICPHLHIPLQAGDDDTLKAMGRHYTQGEYAAIVERIRQALPMAAITTDIMVGFPGEDETRFQNSLAFARKMAFAKIHVFPYSVRPGTKAALFSNQVSPEAKAERVRAMQTVGEEGRARFAAAYIGEPLRVLVEQKEVIGGKSYWTGHSDTYLPVAFLSEKPELKGALLAVSGIKWQEEWLFAALLS